MIDLGFALVIIGLALIRFGSVREMERPADDGTAQRAAHREAITSGRLDEHAAGDGCDPEGIGRREGGS